MVNNLIIEKSYSRDENSVLNQKCIFIDLNQKEKIAHIINDLHQVIVDKNAYGCSANQIGYSEAIFSMRLNDEWFDFINPTITDTSEKKEYFMEGCLSFPGLYVKIKRPVQVTLEWQDLSGEFHMEVFDGLKARIIQHEMDHQNGDRFFDKATKFHMDQAKRKLKKND